MEGTESAGMTWVLARLVVEPHSDITSRMVIMLVWLLRLSQTGESARLVLPALALLCSSSVRRPPSWSVSCMGLVLVLPDDDPR